MKRHNILLALLGFSSVAVLAAERSTMTIRLQSVQSGYFDESDIYFELNAIPDFIINEDELYSYNLNDAAPSIYSYSVEGIKCGKNGFDELSDTRVVPLGVEVKSNGVYRFSIRALSGFDPTSVIRLEDRLYNVFTEIRNGVYNIALNTSESDSGRYYIHITRPAVFTYQDAGCQNNDGSITVNIDSSVPWDVCQLYDSANQPIATLTNVNPTGHFSGLPQGKYFVAFIAGQYSSGKYMQLGGHYINSSIVHSGQPVYVGQPTVFHAVASNTDFYEWNFGDGTLINGVANPPMTFYRTGTFTVTLSCSNSYGCSSTSQIDIIVQSPSDISEHNISHYGIYLEGKSLIMNRGYAISDNSIVQINTLLGQHIFKSVWTNQNLIVDMSTHPSGYYMVTIKNGTHALTKRVYLSN